MKTIHVLNDATATRRSLVVPACGFAGMPMDKRHADGITATHKGQGHRAWSPPLT